MTKIGIIARKNRGFFVEFPDAIMDVDSFGSFDAIFKKKRAIRVPSQKKVSILRPSNFKIAYKN